jgi:hypothetical protein
MAALSFSLVPMRLWPGTGAVPLLESALAGSGSWNGGFIMVGIGVELWVAVVTAAAAAAASVSPQALGWVCCPGRAENPGPDPAAVISISTIRKHGWLPELLSLGQVIVPEVEELKLERQTRHPHDTFIY